jgi:predicted flap endonuclease-1-like 5' DNA nuclease/chromosome segregation ATPase
MLSLIQHLMLPLLAVALFGALAGWCWHCVRNYERVEKLVGVRDRLRQEFAGLTSSLPGLRGLAPDPELEAAKMRADVAVAKVVELERGREDLLAERDRFSARANELEMSLASARAAQDGQNWSMRIATLENERDAALRELDDARLLFETERNDWASERSAFAAAPAPAQPTTVPTVEDRASAWRLRLLEGRTEFLESRLRAARAIAQRHDPRLTILENEKAQRDAEISRLKDAITAFERRPAPPAAIAAIPAAPEQDLNLLRWQARYLTERVNYLEGQARIAPTEPVAVEQPAPALDVEALNRRAWRQRYLEARLSYYEGRWTDDRAGKLSALSDVQTRQSQIDALNQELFALRASAGADRTRLSDLERDLAAARAQSTDLRAAHDRLNEERNSLQVRLQEIEALNQQIAALKAQASQVDLLSGQIVSFRSQIAQKDAQREALASELAAMKARLAEEHQLNREIASLKNSLAERDAEIARFADAPKPAFDETEMMHLRFRTRYLDDRVKFLEARLAAQPIARASAPPRQTFLPAEPSAEEVRPIALPAARSGAPDDLRLIDGVSPRIESTLNSLGVYHFDQIAAWTGQNVAWIERYLAYKGRISRERWIEQARALARGEEDRPTRRYREDEQV